MARAACDDHDILLAVAPSIGDGRGISNRIQLRHPQLPTRARFKRPEFSVRGSRNENQPARPGYGASEVNRAGVL